MTVIVAARLRDGGIGLAADSLTTAGWEKRQNDRSKLWSSDPYVLGAAGCVRTSQLIRHMTSWPKYRADEESDVEAFLVKNVVPAIRLAVKDAGVVMNHNGQEYIDSELVIGWGDHLAIVAANGAVGVPKAGRCAIGSGYAEALGSLGDRGPWTIEQVIAAARVATVSAVGCDGPITYITTNDMTVREAQ